MRRLVLLLTTLACLVVPAALAKGSFPETIPLPNGFQPEGIAVGKGDTFYVGSIPTGAVYAGSLRTGTGNVLVPGATGHAATGLKYDHGRLWVSGAGTGKAFVYSARTGALLQGAPARDQRRPDVHQRRRRHVAGGVLHRLERPGDLQGLEVMVGLAGSRDRDPAHRRLPARRRVQPERHRRDAERQDAARRPERDREALHDRPEDRRDEAHRPRRRNASER